MHCIEPVEIKKSSIRNSGKTLVYFLLISFAFIFISCGNDKENIKVTSKIDLIFNQKLNNLEKNPQFIIDKLEILFFKKGSNNKEAHQLIKEIPKKYKRIIFVFSLIFDGKLPENVNPDSYLLKLLLKFQESDKALTFIAENYHKSSKDLAVKAFYTLYALNYKFTEENYKNYSEVKELSEFIKLSFINKKIDYCEGDKCSEDLIVPENRENFINNINQQLYYFDETKLAKNKSIYKNSFKHIKSLKKEIKKITKKNKKLKRKKKLEAEDEQLLVDKKDELIFYQKELIPNLKKYLYFHDKERKLPRSFNKWEITTNFLRNNTTINKKILYFILSNIKYKSYPTKLVFYKYLKASTLKVSKRYEQKIKYLKHTKEFHLLRYGFFKKHFPELFKKLNVKSYLGSRFVYTVVKDFEWYFLENLRTNNKKVKNLLYFQYAPELIKAQKDKLFKIYTTDTIENIKIAGNESYIFTLLKIFLKGNIKLSKEQIEVLKPIRIVYIQEIIKHFK